MSNTPSKNRWLPGWTLSAPLEELFRETTTPLSITLSESAGTIILASPDTAFQLDIQCANVMDCKVCSAGFRITDAGANRDSVTSAIMLDSTSMILEADESMIQQVATHPGFEQTIDEAFYFADEEQHRLGILIDMQSVPRRIAVVTGTGDREIMCARARGYLIKSAHTLLDTALNELREKSENIAIAPFELIKSRMHPATSHIPYPWLADSDAEPVWNLAILHPIFHVFLESDINIAAGMIRNILELMDENGNLPVAGGNIGQPIMGLASHPMISSMCAAFHKKTGKLPDTAASTIQSLTSYLIALIKDWEDDKPGNAPKTVLLQLLQHELMSLRYIAKSTGRQGDKTVLATVKAGLAVFEQENEIPDTAFQPVLELTAAPRISNKQMREKLSVAANQSLQLLEVNRDDLSTTPCLMILASDCYQAADYRAYSKWITRVKESGENQWTQTSGKPNTIDKSAERLAYAAMIVSASTQSATAFDRNKLREQKLAEFVEQNKKWIVTTGSLVVVALLGFIISVQMRQTMPSSIYETKVGMTLEHYKAKQYQEALNLIKDMEQQGGAEYTRIRFIKGKVQFMMEDYESAAENFLYCIDKKPDTPSAHYNLALCLFRSGDLDKAEEQFTKIQDLFERRYPIIGAYAKHAKTLIAELKQNRGTVEKDEERGAPRRSG